MRKVWIASVALASLALGGCGLNPTPADGTKIGQVIKLSREGLLSKTWEAQLIRGGMNNGSGSFGVKPFDFTVEGEALVQKVQQYLENQTEVVIRYRTEGIYSAFRTESGGIFLVSIEPAKK